MGQSGWRCSWEEHHSLPGLFRRAPGSLVPAEITVQLPQGTIGLQLHSTARVCELYSVAPGGEASYVSTCRGTQLPGQQLWALDHIWPQAWLVPPMVRLRLFSLLERDELRLTSLQLMPVPELQSSAAQEAPVTSNRAAVSGADWSALWDTPSIASMAAQPSAAASPKAAHASQSVPAAASAAAPAAAPAAPTAGGSQIDDVRQMLSRLKAEETNNGVTAVDPKRALMVSLANAVLRQPAAPPPSQQLQQAHASTHEGWQQQQQQQDVSSLLQQAAPLLEEWRHLQQRQEEQQQHMAQALRQVEQQQEQQHHQMAGLLARLEKQQERQQRLTAEVLGRLEQRVAAVESLCHDMSAMLRQLVAQQQRVKQPMRAGVSGLGVM